MGIFDGIVLCSDIDGTLTYKRELSAENASAIRHFQQNGGIFVLCTGRGQDYLERFSDNFLVGPYSVTVNGTMIHDTQQGKLLEKWTLPTSVIDTVSSFLRESMQLIKNHIVVDTGENIQYDPPKMNFSDEIRPICKIVLVMESEEATTALEAQLLQRLGQTAQICRSWATGVEILPKGSGKGASINKLREILKDKSDLFVAVGDYENDVSMFEAADLSYGVSSGSEKIFPYVDHLTPPAKEHAIAFVIKELEEMQRAKYLY